ncbi:polyhomeotic-like protein 2 isoform X3 [Salmo trutta]|uniref:polyhomeotic-like protein 2 isoform X3 n=1 Tax=Salmo trutta TaxID=8032 RepID=UPI0011314320|nr:polyhomeotic-like protein 2 isoform X3 [Salmo trutta]
MQNEAQGPAAASASSISTTPSVNTSLVTTSSTGRPTLPHISVYAGIPGRQTAQVIQQALHRQPSTAAQYLQQMYAAQQQHLMLQTAALQQQQQQQQQQQLSNAQLQRLAGVQQVHATIVTGRQSSNQNWTSSHQTCTTQTTVNPATPPAAAQIINRVQSVSSTPSCIPQQAVLLGNASSLVLTASQAQMYLRAQMLIFTPTAAVATVQSAASSQSATNQQSASAQVQNLAICSQQGAPSSQLQGLHLKQMSGGAQVSLSGQLRGPTQGPQGTQLGSLKDPSKGGQKGEGHFVSVSRSVMAVSSHPLISPAYAQIQTHQFLQQQKQQQFVFQQQRHQTQQLSLRGQAPVLHTASIHSHSQAQMLQALAIQPQPKEGPVPVLPKPFISANVPSQQATIFHSTVSPQILTHNGPTPVVTQTQAAPLPNTKLVQMAAVDLQIQPTSLTPASQLVQDGAGKELPTSEVVTENSSTPLLQQPTAPPILEVITIEQCPSDPSNPTTPTGAGKGDAEWLNAQPGAGSLPVMTSGNGNNAPMVTGSTPQNGESKLPQAIVKPQILTHFIEGFVIQEGAEPFPVDRPLSLLIENLKKHKQQTHSDSEKTTTSSNSTTDSEMEDLSQQELKQQEEPTLTCELCGRVDFAYNFKRSKRFCSTVCAKRYNVGCTKRMGLFPNRQTTMEKLKKQRTSIGTSSSETKKQTPTTGQQPGGGSVTSSHPSHPGHREFSQCLDMSSYEGPPSPPLSAASSSAPRSQASRGAEHTEGCGQELPLFQPSDPAKWNVEEVYEFICSLPGCLEIAKEFRSQEIDGQSLLLLKEDHLMGTMNIKLGPALKLFAEISMLRDS